MPNEIETLLASATLFRRLSVEDRRRIAEVASARRYRRGDAVFREGDPPDFLYTVLSGQVKIVRMTPSGQEVILEVFGAGDPLGAVVVYEGRPYLATAVALEDSVCLRVPRADLFALLERYPSLTRGLLSGLTLRLVELTNRVTELTGGRVENRLARLFLRLADELGRPEEGGTFVPLALSRQELADMTGTTIETCIRIMSRWSKEGVMRTESRGFLILDRAHLEVLALS